MSMSDASSATLHPVESSMMSHVGYDPTTQTLTILFKSGKTYLYSDVEQEIYDELMLSSSKGRFFRDMIDDCYPYQLVGKRTRR